MGVNEVGMGSVFRTEIVYPYHHQHTGMEKRQLFLRSYQFCRKKKSVSEKITGFLFRVKGIIWVRIQSTMKVRKMVWFRLKHGLFNATRKMRFLYLHNPNNNKNNNNNIKSWSCFW
ncbi:hypothetical protein ACSBR2_003991 [Camellia fascicularis]